MNQIFSQGQDLKTGVFYRVTRGEEDKPQQFFVRATSESSSLDYFVLKSFQFLKIKLFFFNLATLGHTLWMDLVLQ